MRWSDKQAACVVAAVHESAFGTSGHFGAPAICPLLGAKRTWLCGDAASAFDPKRTKAGLKSRSAAGSCRILSRAILWSRWGQRPVVAEMTFSSDSDGRQQSVELEQR